MKRHRFLIYDTKKLAVCIGAKNLVSNFKIKGFENNKTPNQKITLKQSEAIEFFLKQFCGDNCFLFGLFWFAFQPVQKINTLRVEKGQSSLNVNGKSAKNCVYVTTILKN